MLKVKYAYVLEREQRISYWISYIMTVSLTFQSASTARKQKIGLHYV